MNAAVVEQRQLAVLRFCHALVAATMDLSLHHPDSQYAIDALRQLLLELQIADGLGVDMPLSIQIADDCLCYDGLRQEGPSLQAGRLLELCAERDIAALAFGPELQIDELQRFFDLLLRPDNRAALQRRHRDRVLRAMGIRHLRVQSRVPGDPSDPSRQVAPRHDGDLRQYQQLADCLQQSHVQALHDRELPVDHTQGVVEQALLRLESEPSGLLSLAAQDNIDRFTVGHSVRVALLALQVARAVGADRRQLVRVGTAALLHDIGKSKVPQEILFKPGRLNQQEWRWMAQHPRLGAQILIEQHEIDANAIGAAFCHHMRPLGDGYYPITALPMQPSGTSRLVRVCDVFEALTSLRPYKRALSPCEAYAVMFRQSCDFDQHWLRVFVRTLGLFPIGTRVLLRDGATAQVVRQTDDPRRPLVRLLTAAGGADLQPGQPDEVAIGVAAAGVVPGIAKVVTQDRAVAMPDEDLSDPQILTQPLNAHGCLGPLPPPPA